MVGLIHNEEPASFTTMNLYTQNCSARIFSVWYQKVATYIYLYTVGCPYEHKWKRALLYAHINVELCSRNGGGSEANKSCIPCNFTNEVAWERRLIYVTSYTHIWIENIYLNKCEDSRFQMWIYHQTTFGCKEQIIIVILESR